MSNEKGYVIAPKLGFWTKVRASLASEFEVLDRDHKIFVPEKLVLGDFKKRDDDFVYSGSQPFYRDVKIFPDGLQEYQEHLDEERFEIVKELGFSKEALEETLKKGRIYYQVYMARSLAMNELVGITKYLDNSFGDTFFTRLKKE